MFFRPVLLAAAVLTLAACGADADGVPADQPVELNEGPATCDPGEVIVGSGASRVARTAGIRFDMDNPPEDLNVWVSGPGGKHSGELLHDRGDAILLPTDPWPANAELTWNVEMCGQTYSGTFETGELVRPVSAGELDDRFLGETFAVDLRAAEWTAPAAAPRTALRLGGAFLLEVMARDAAAMTVAITAAYPDNAAGYEPIEGELPVALQVSLADNPYVSFPIDGMRLPTTHGQVILRDAVLTVGLSADGVTDGRLVGTLDVSGIGDGDDFEACTLLAADGVECQPCGMGMCVPLRLDDVFGLEM